MKLKKLLSVRWTPQRLFFVVAACMYLLLTTLPGSRWLVRHHTANLKFFGQMAMAPWQDNERAQNIAEAARHPGDFQMLFAAALQKPEGPPFDGISVSRDRAQRLWKLRLLFPDEPALYAGVIRCLTGIGVRTGRDAEQDILLRPTSPAAPVKRARKPPVSTLNEWHAEAAEVGARLDPENGFFPMMQAVTFFATNQDAEGLAALHRASQKPRWNDYASEEALSGDKLTHAAHGETGTLARTARYAAIMYPHLGQYRATARVAISLAVRKELAGDIDGGMAIRRSVARCGALMRSESPSYIGAIMGMSITQVAMSRPGGAVAPESRNSVNVHDTARLRTERFIAYADSIGRTDDAAFFQAEGIAREDAKALHRVVEEKSVFSVSRLTKMMALWSGGSALVSNALVVLVLGAIAYGLAQTPRLRSGQPLHPAIRWALAAVTVPIPFAVVGLGFLGGEGILVGYSAAFLSVSGAALAGLLLGKERRRNLLIFVATVPSLAVILGIVILGSVPAFQMAKEMADALGLRDFGVVPAFHMMTDNSNGLPGLIWVLLPIFGGVVFFAAWLSSLAILARCRRIPVSVGIVRGAAGSALTVAAIWLFAYAVVALVTLRAEQQGLAELAEMTRHEGRYYARLAGRPWPGLPAEQ